MSEYPIDSKFDPFLKNTRFKKICEMKSNNITEKAISYKEKHFSSKLVFVYEN